MSVIGLVVTGKTGGNAMTWHFRLGYGVLVLLAFRVLWGLVGGRWSRFKSFTYGPGALARYLAGQPRAGEMFHVGHSPLGALSVFALLAALVVQVLTGLVSWDDILQIGGPLNRFVSEPLANRALGYHSTVGQWVLIALIVLHVAAVLVYLLRRRNLIAPMWHGDKWLAHGTPATTDTRATRLTALALAAACAGAVFWLATLGQ